MNCFPTHVAEMGSSHQPALLTVRKIMIQSRVKTQAGATLLGIKGDR